MQGQAEGKEDEQVGGTEADALIWMCKACSYGIIEDGRRDTRPRDGHEPECRPDGLSGRGGRLD